MSEEFLHFLWKNQLFEKDSLRTASGEKILIVDVGEKNYDSGPDFFNAKIEIEGLLWVGNVEIHIKSSDWNRHKHNLDPAYDNVILHVVAENDKETVGTNGRNIPVLEIEVAEEYHEKYRQMMSSRLWIPCQQELFKIDPFRIKFWLGKILVERLKDKTGQFFALLEHNNNNWEESFYQGLAKSFGFKVNSLQFERLARSLPLKYLLQHKDNLFQLEALLFGQAGLLSEDLFGDEYYQGLKKEYEFFRKKFELKPLEKHIWRFMRMRPLNFPTIRIAQFASMIHHSSGNLFSACMEAESHETLMEVFNFQVSPYWGNHYQFNKESINISKNMGLDAKYSILINTIIPFLFMFGEQKGRNDLKERSVKFLEEIPPEKNKLIRQWAEAGIQSDNAFYTQSLIQLRNSYCKYKRCLDCEIGNQIIIFNK
ncbi:MAG: DUF2851 family protein [Bacteroidales bacterium]|nr:DUF2851 family protein [Bacteroidales bacterium]